MKATNCDVGIDRFALSILLLIFFGTLLLAFRILGLLRREDEKVSAHHICMYMTTMRLYLCADRRSIDDVVDVMFEHLRSRQSDMENSADD